MNYSLLIFLKGLFMGFADIIPGISGGTIAFITGIYERLVKAVKDITKIPFIIHKQSLTKTLKLIDYKFVLPLITGIAIAIIIGANIISSLIEAIPFIVYGFFAGLIASSALHILEGVKTTYSNTSLLLLAIFTGFLIGFFSFEITNIGFLGIVSLGFIAISALILPGISGAYILLMFGQYEYIINSIKNFDWFVLSSFAIGAILGLALLSRIISYLYDNYRQGTLSTLTGLMIGALIVPLREIIETGEVIIGLSAALVTILFYYIIISFNK